MNLVIAGIHTGIGKTFVSTLLVEALQWDYWKPVQAGDLVWPDSLFVQRHILNSTTTIHPEAYRLKKAASPHDAAAVEGIKIELDQIKIPRTKNGLIIETAGGVLSPLADGVTNIDQMKQLGCPVVLVTQDYLGSINHTLLTIQALQAADVPILGLIFNGKEVRATRKYLTDHGGVPKLFALPHFVAPDAHSMSLFAACISSQLKRILNGLCARI
jgi:dethiobiotin synthetase